nr:zinc finger MYM-type protein 1-like [Hydra vulgaris]
MLLDLVNKIFIPYSSFIFPISGEKKKRSFLPKWLLKYSWLAYSQIEDGAYCLPCTLLRSRIPNNTSITNFVRKPFKIWGNAIRAYMDHNNNCQLHQMSMHCLNMLQSRSNSKKNLSETIIFLGRNDIAFRGHRDDSKYHPEIGETCKNNIGIGNFVELLNFCIKAGDKVLEHHIRSAPKNATYISKTTQNELIECCGKTIEEVLINKIKKSGYFSILCDGASDCSNVEQLSLVIRYIDCDNVICEDFLWFIECKSGTTGLSLGQNIVSAIDDLGLDIQKCRGQGYDGAGAMSGKLKGISSRIKFINSKAIFVHCACHKLNLVVSKSCNVQSVRNVLDQIKDISYFFHLSPKRVSCLNKFIFPGQAKLINTCQTRWVQKLKGLDVFFDNYISVFHSMEEMAYNEREVGYATTIQVKVYPYKVDKGNSSSNNACNLPSLNRNLYEITSNILEYPQTYDDDTNDC